MTKKTRREVEKMLDKCRDGIKMRTFSREGIEFDKEPELVELLDDYEAEFSQYEHGGLLSLDPRVDIIAAYLLVKPMSRVELFAPQQLASDFVEGLQEYFYTDIKTKDVEDLGKSDYHHLIYLSRFKGPIEIVASLHDVGRVVDADIDGTLLGYGPVNTFGYCREVGLDERIK